MLLFFAPLLGNAKWPLHFGWRIWVIEVNCAISFSWEYFNDGILWPWWNYLDSLRYLPQIFLCKLLSISMRCYNDLNNISNCNPVSEKKNIMLIMFHHSLTHTRTLFYLFYFCIKTTHCFSRNSEEEKYQRKIDRKL